MQKYTTSPHFVGININRVEWLFRSISNNEKQLQYFRRHRWKKNKENGHSLGKPLIFKIFVKLFLVDVVTRILLVVTTVTDYEGI